MALFVSGLLNIDNITDDGTLNLDRARGITGIEIGGRAFVYVAGENDDGIGGFEVGPTGTVTAVPGALINDPAAPLDEPSQTLAVTINGNSFLYVGNNSADGITVFSIGTDGSLTFIENIPDDGTLEVDGIFTGLKHVNVGGTDYLINSAFADDGLSTFRIEADGRLTNIDNVDDADNAAFLLDGASQLDTITIGSRTFALVTGQSDDGLNVFEVNADGTLTFVQAVADNGTLNLNGALGVATVTVGGVNYVIAGGEFDDGLSVFSIDEFGLLTPVFDLADNADLGLNGVAELNTFSAGGEQFLIASGFQDDAINLFHIENGGILTPIDTVFDADSAPLELNGSVFNEFLKFNGKQFVFASGQNDDGISSFEIGGAPDILVGTTDADIILGFGDDDTLFGNDGDDTILGGTEDDFLGGGMGSDSLIGQLGDDTLIGGADNDTLRGNEGRDSLQGSSGEDFLTGNNGRDTLSGGDGRDSLLGGNGVDSIDGGSGNDTLRGEADNDTLDGGAGRDTIRGGEGNDRIDGGSGRDDIRGDGGNDRIDAGSAGDIARGGDGNDRIEGGGGNDDIRGQTGNDRLFGGSLHDELFGGQDDDTLQGGTGRDTLNGGTGNDFMTGGLGRDVFAYQAGGGIDRIFDFASNDRIDLTSFNFDSFDDVLAIARDVGTSLRFEFSPTDRLVVNDLQLADLSASDVFI